MEQVGYDTYCKLLDEIIKENKGIKVEEETEITIDVNVSSYIPNEYIEDNGQKIDVYQKIALCKTQEDIKNISEDITDRYGRMPVEIINLIKIAKIKEMCREAGINKIAQRQDKIIFYIEEGIFKLSVEDLVKRYGNKIKFSATAKPYITYTLNEKCDILEEIEKFLDEGEKSGNNQ